MNFGLEITANVDSTADPTMLYVTPEGAYDRDQHNFFECDSWNSCTNQLMEHFNKVTSMGFNTVRLVGEIVARPVRRLGGAYGYQISVHPNIPYSTKYRLDIGMPTFTDSLSQRYFSMVRHVLDVADSADLKVIFLSGGGVEKGPGMPSGDLQYDTLDVQHYSEFLAALSTALQGHPALLAYDLWNEPAWASVGATNLKKAEVCEFTTQWYDVLKAHDPEHLVTLGGASISELNSWDPAVMKLDFYSPHMYPTILVHDGYNVPSSYERVRNELYWTGSTCPMPWLVGETAFSADDDTTDYLQDPNWNDLDSLPEHHRMPWMWGNEDEQAAYARVSMDATRNYLGSGYSWWGFQNVRHPPYQDSTPGNAALKYLGVLGYGNGTLQQRWRDKKVVDTLSAYVTPPAPAGLPSPPDYYYNSCQMDGDSVYSWGSVLDQNGAPVKDAMVECGWPYVASNGNPLGDPVLDPQQVWDRIPSDADGNFTVLRPPTVSPPFTRFGLLPVNSKLTVSGGSGYEHAVDGYPPGVVFDVDRSVMPYSLALTDLVIIGGDFQDHRAWNDIQVGGESFIGWPAQSDITGSDLHARSSIHLTGEFHAQTGTEVHLWTEPTFPICARPEYKMSVAHARMRTAEADQSNSERKITLQFDEPNTLLRLYPNPAREFVVIEAPGLSGECAIVDDLGREVITFALRAAKQQVELHALAAGEYTLYIKQSNVPPVAFTHSP